jgi:glycosyltransferase involved in cell wall biosynthesis
MPTRQNIDILLVIIDRQVGGSEARFLGLLDHFNDQKIGINVEFIINDELIAKSHNQVYDRLSTKVSIIKTRYGSTSGKSSGITRVFRAANILLMLLFLGYKISRLNKQKITHFIGYQGMLLSIPSLLLGRKVGYSVIGYESRVFRDKNPAPFFYNKAFISYCLERASFIDVLGQEVYDNLLLKGSGVVGKLYNNGTYVDHQEFISNTKNGTIAYIARFEYYKQPLLFLHVAKILISKDSNIRFVMVGEGGEIEKVKKYIYENKMENNVSLIVGGNPAQVLSKSVVFLSLQLHENYPSRSLLEAMSCANAVVATNVGYTYLLVDDGNGVLVDQDPQNIARQVYKLLRSSSLGNKMNESRKRITSKYTKDKYLNNLFSMYKKSCSQKYTTI